MPQRGVVLPPNGFWIAPLHPPDVSVHVEYPHQYCIFCPRMLVLGQYDILVLGHMVLEHILTCVRVLRYIAFQSDTVPLH